MIVSTFLMPEPDCHIEESLRLPVMICKPWVRHRQEYIKIRRPERLVANFYFYCRKGTLNGKEDAICLFVQIPIFMKGSLRYSAIA